ncbi:hypothetical protein EMIT0P176_90029 [Pseudomonas sp. IT-P176]
MNEEVIWGADCKRKKASCTTSSARDRQPVMRAAVFTSISRLSTNAWSKDESQLSVETDCAMEVTSLQKVSGTTSASDPSYALSDKLG